MPSYSIRQVLNPHEFSELKRLGDVIEIVDAPTAKGALNEFVDRLKSDNDKFEVFKKVDRYGCPCFKSENTQNPADVASRPVFYEEGSFDDDDIKVMDEVWDEIAEEDNRQL